MPQEVLEYLRKTDSINNVGLRWSRDKSENYAEPPRGFCVFR